MIYYCVKIFGQHKLWVLEIAYAADVIDKIQYILHRWTHELGTKPQDSAISVPQFLADFQVMERCATMRLELGADLRNNVTTPLEKPVYKALLIYLSEEVLHGSCRWMPGEECRYLPCYVSSIKLDWRENSLLRSSNSRFNPFTRPWNHPAL